MRLGKPGKFLLDAGIAEGDIQLDYDKFIRKSKNNYKNDHPFAKDDIKDLPKAINYPIAVFQNTDDKSSDHVILTELKKDGQNFIVVVRAMEENRKGGVVLVVNRIQTLFPKNAKGIVNWIINEKYTNIDKQKALDWIKALRTHPGTSIDSGELSNAANKIKNLDIDKFLEKKNAETAENNSEAKWFKGSKTRGILTYQEEGT